MRTGVTLLLLLLLLLLSGLSAGAQSAENSTADPRALYEQGRREQARGNLPAAVELYRASLEANPAYLDPLVGLAEAFFALEEYEEALGYVQEARKYDREDLQLLVLQGRIYGVLGKGAEARSAFQKVLDREPNNLGARFGLAELDIAQGRSSDATRRYLETLKIRPENQRALLSLVVLSESRGEQQRARDYLELALKYHSYDSRVHLAAARFAVDTGQLQRAEQHLLTAIALDSSYQEARRLLAQVYLLLGQPEKAISELRKILASNRDSPLVWYTLGLAYDRSGDEGQAIRSLAQALRLRPDDEIARITLEAIALEKLPIKDPIRVRYAAYHLQRGDLFKERNLLAKARMEYRRALRLDPEGKPARLSYAELYRLTGFPVKYMKELEVLRDLGYTDPVILDNIEIVQSETWESVAARWGIDQYSLEKKRFALAVFHLEPASRDLHLYAGRAAAGYFLDILRRYPNLEVQKTPVNVGSFQEAFQEARRLESDYFSVLHVEESERSFTAVLDQYLTATGKKLASYRVFRTGNDRIQNTFNTLAERAVGALPVRGVLLDREFDQGLIDLGRLEGLGKGEEFLIVKKGAVRLANDSITVRAEESDILGSFTVTAVDETVSEGTVSKQEFFDLINQGDEIIRPAAPPQVPESGKPTEAEGLLRRLLGYVGL